MIIDHQPHTTYYIFVPIMLVSSIYINSTPNLDFDIFWYKWFILQDVLTDLKADAETLPLDPIKEDWVGHKVIYYVADAFILVSIYMENHFYLKSTIANTIIMQKLVWPLLYSFR